MIAIAGMNEAKIELGFGAKFQIFHRCEIGVVGALLDHRYMENWIAS